MATRDRAPASTLGAEPPWGTDEGPHQIAGVHSHAGYPSQEDLDTRLTAASGVVPGEGLQTPPAPEPAPDAPAQQPSSRR